MTAGVIVVEQTVHVRLHLFGQSEHLLACGVGDAAGPRPPQWQGDGYWMREVARECFPGRASTRELSVLATDSGTALAGCMGSSLHETLPTPLR